MRLTIKIKLAIAFGLLILLLAGVAGFGIVSLGNLNQTISDVISGPAARLELAQRMNVDQLMVVRSEKNMLLASSAEDARRAIEIGQRARQDYIEALDRMDEITTPDFAQAWRDTRAEVMQLFEVGDRVQALYQAGNVQAATALSSGEGRQLVNAIEEDLVATVERNRERMTEADHATNQQYESTRNLIILVTVAALLLGVGAALWIALGINKGLTRVTQVVNGVAIGDLNQRVEITTNDEIKDLVDTINGMTGNLRNTAGIADQVANGDLTVVIKPLSDKDTLGIALQSMVERLRGVVGDTLSAVDNVSAGSQELSASSEQVSQGATEQAASAEEASASMEQMAANIKQNADNAAQTEQIARQSSKAAEASGEAVNRAVDAMRTIADKIGIVQEIARQT
ncbi:MAG TPA: HAMP domain-containing protein, partial [Verrucomicrobiae bacterium]|nr:HAMP domain-containing protein [Verrucomicrobiae bacterium]